MQCGGDGVKSTVLQGEGRGLVKSTTMTVFFMKSIMHVHLWFSLFFYFLQRVMVALDEEYSMILDVPYVSMAGMAKIHAKR